MANIRMSKKSYILHLIVSPIWSCYSVEMKSVGVLSTMLKCGNGNSFLITSTLHAREEILYLCIVILYLLHDRTSDSKPMT